MKEWKDYAQSRGATRAGEGTAEPTVGEYFQIKMADNWIAVTIIVVTLIFSLIGVGCTFSDKASVSGTASWFFDAAKLCLGVFLGLLTNQKTR